MIDVVISGAGPNGLMLAGELGLAGVRPVVLDPMPGTNPQRRVNGIIGQGVRILDHRGLYSTLAGTDEPPQLAPRAMFAAFALDLALAPNSQGSSITPALAGDIAAPTTSVEMRVFEVDDEE